MKTETKDAGPVGNPLPDPQRSAISTAIELLKKEKDIDPNEAKETTEQMLAQVEASKDTAWKYCPPLSKKDHHIFEMALKGEIPNRLSIDADKQAEHEFSPREEFFITVIREDGQDTGLVIEALDTTKEPSGYQLQLEAADLPALTARVNYLKELLDEALVKFETPPPHS